MGSTQVESKGEGPFSRGLLVYVTCCIVIQSMHLAWVRPRSSAKVRVLFSGGLLVFVTCCIVIQSMQLACWFDPLRGRVRVLFSRGLVVYVKHCTVIQSMLLGWVRAASRQSEGLFQSWPNGICHTCHCNPIRASYVGSSRARVGFFSVVAYWCM